jgi:ParB/RepB/Spo0J family partition protein
MSSRRGAWISRRGQAGVEAAIDQVIDRQPQSGEQVQQLADDLIEDSPYQARQPFNDDSLADLVQGMREAGFQGVLIVRPHSDLAKRQRGLCQLVYGHRRRMAWRRVCAERGQPCLLPVVIREVSDAQLLTIGAQENLQRQDLDPVEEAQIVAWHERMFFDKNQAEIGAMLGKSSDWVSVRSRVHKLPDALKERLRQRPRAIKQVLELAAVYGHQPDLALSVADRVVNENLTVEAVRAIMREQHKNREPIYIREEKHRCRAGATFVQRITNRSPLSERPTLDEAGNEPQATAVRRQQSDSSQSPTASAQIDESISPAGQPPHEPALSDNTARMRTDLLLLQEAAAALASLAVRADALPTGMATEQALDQAEQALATLRRTLRHLVLPDDGPK